jgi:hypothetical protein
LIEAIGYNDPYRVPKGDKMMTATGLLAILILLLLAIVFGITWKIKGLKVAFVATGATFIVSSILYVAAISMIVSAMD